MERKECVIIYLFVDYLFNTIGLLYVIENNDTSNNFTFKKMNERTVIEEQKISKAKSYKHANTIYLFSFLPSIKCSHSIHLQTIRHI